MYHVRLRKNNRIQRKMRVRRRILGKSNELRLTVFRSNKYIYAQIVDDTKGATLVEASSKSMKNLKGKTKCEEAFEVGKEIAKKALSKDIKTVVFDRNGFRYHGRIKSVADGAREGGLRL
ncbi:50S ribosomal protein L18 [candidate division WWE3 bacterium]|uniref:Large ribosomal subunit protein uL18 n=1 Tax=candidate division WWE3 bacterium TaxID=2053526 RepID=A0A7X9HSR0_UNCKA|nr:50S ribosomal protein L18 [candidate division WWE3 bacterium]